MVGRRHYRTRGPSDEPILGQGDSIGKTGLANGAAQQCRSVGKIAQMLFYLEDGLGQLGQIPGTVLNIDRQHISALGR